MAIGIVLSALIVGCDQSPTVADLPLQQRSGLARTATGGIAIKSSGDSATEISETRARELAAALWRSAAEFLHVGVASDRGGPVHWRQLNACQRAYYVTSAYRHVDPGAPLLVRKALGPFWLVGLCYGDIQEVVVAVSAYADDAEVSSGQQRLSRPGTANFRIMGVPVGAEIPIPPEGVIAMTERETGRSVVAPPLLVMRPFPQSPFTAVWHVTLDAPAVITGHESEVTRAVKTLYAGHLNGWNQPTIAVGNAANAINASDNEIQEFFWSSSPHHTQYGVARRSAVARDLELISVEGR